ncbi:putative mitochondrial protein [Cucumis melo var. makuwa]|uniref:Putative mitochondrial protein n=1 Tax=Cucumis melo var. makuwa TaxID=1194695 RepID=A0A5D3D6W6_CUCMM|nr:putative mitochondrial protein [Cucumis melo var. makuwa]
MKDLGTLSYFLGLEISSSSQAKYGITDSTTSLPPLDLNLPLTPFDGVPLDDLTLFSNADWTCDLTDRRSTTGYSFYLDATSELIWLCWLLIDIGALNNYPLLFIMITAVPFKLLTMMSFMNEESTLRMIIILFAIIFKAILFNSNPSPPSTNNRYLHQNPPFFSLHSASSQNQGGIYSTLLSLKRVLS